MALTRFEFAPPPVGIAAGLAVPIDIHRVEARLRFNPLLADTLDATVWFVTGLADGLPVFDFRQTVRHAWLDGAAIPPERLAHHDLGGGPDAEMRVVERVLPANTPHTLRLLADLGPPRVRTDNNRRPVLLWTDRCRLTFRFGFTDRRPARYLESWIPSNLIFDEFALVLHVSVEQTNISHRVVTNGDVEAQGFNRWIVRFPDNTTSFLPMLEIMAADRLESLRASVQLPSSGRSVAVEVWKEKGDPTPLDAVLATARQAMSEYEARFGHYPHGDRFVIMADANSGGMEYLAGATGDLSSMRHEIAHSWWGRGIRPASQPDSWFDEAWATYSIDKATGPRQGFVDISGRRIAIAPPAPWSRVTVLEAYSAGVQVFTELAAMIGPAQLESVMRDLFASQLGTPLTTATLEAHIVRHVPRAEAVDLFHRWVYGLDDPLRPPQLVFPVAALGMQSPFPSETAWDSPSLWVRHQNDGGTEHQAPDWGRENWVYARVRNDGPDSVAHAVVVFRADPTPLIDPCGPTVPAVAIGASVQRDWLPGEERLVTIPWDHPAASSFTLSAQVLSTGLLRLACPEVLNRDNLAWKTRADGLAFAGSLAFGTVSIGNRFSPDPQPLRLELIRNLAAERASVVISHPAGLPIASGSLPLSNAVEGSFGEDPLTEFTFSTSPSSSLLLDLPPSAVYNTSLQITLPDDVAVGEVFRVDLVALRPNDQSIVWGMTIVLTAP